MVYDIEKNELNVGDEVYYARKSNYHAKGELIKMRITKIQPNGHVSMGQYTSTTPEQQLLKIRNKRLPIDEENNIRRFLTEYGQDLLRIDIDVTSGIYVFDENDGVMREIEFKEDIPREEAVNEIINKLRQIL